ncbi:reductive dehalogenase [Chloroflexota bacterium]
MAKPSLEAEQPTYEIVGKVERFDQRDHPNARRALVPGTPEYEEYYSAHAECKEWDDENRRLRATMTKRKGEKDPVNTQFRTAVFYGRYVLGLQSIVDGTVHLAKAPSDVPQRVDVDPDEMTRKIKAFAMYLGAAKVRITKLRQEWVYTNFAHPYTPEPYGKRVELDYENVICMAFPQDMRMIKCGVGTAVETEVGWKYAYGSLASVVLAQFIRGTGWRARALPPENAPYLVVPTFVDAGIGEQGRCGHVVTKEFGNKFRPGAVATDMPLAIDKPVDFGLQDFCEKCQICADYCPSHAITHEGKEVIRGVRRWHLDSAKCRRYWDTIGSTCGICQAVCPWSHQNNLVHDTVRELAQSSPPLRKLLVQGEKIFYGKFKPAPQPDWIKLKGTRN